MAWLYHKIFDTHKELTRDAALKKLPKVSLEKLVESKSLRAGDVLLVRSDAEVPGSDLHCHPQVSRGVAASCRVPCNKKVTLNGWTEIHVVLGGSVACELHARHVGNLDEAAAKEFAARLRSKTKRSPRGSSSSRRLVHHGRGDERAVLSAGAGGLSLRALHSAWQHWLDDESTVVALRRLVAPDDRYRHYLEEAFDACGSAMLAYLESAAGVGTSGVVLLSWQEAVRCDHVGGVASQALKAVAAGFDAPLPYTKTPAKEAFFRYDVNDRGELDVDTVVAALKSIPAVHLKSADLRGDVDKFSDEDTLDILQFQSLVDSILDLPPAPHLDRDAYGALSAGFCVGLLRAMAAVEPLDDDDAPAPDTLPTTASFGEDDPPLPWRDGFGLEPLIRVDVAPAS